MSRTIEYIAVTLIGIALVFLLVEPIITKTAASLNSTADMIQHATR